MSDKLANVFFPVLIAFVIGSIWYGFRTREVVVRRVSPPNAEGDCTVLFSNGWVRVGKAYCIFVAGDSVGVSL